MGRRGTGPVAFQARDGCVIDTQAGQQQGCAHCQRHAPERCLSIYFPVVPVDTGAALHLARCHRRQGEACPRGFSLIELLIVLGIILTLAALAIPSMLSAIDAAKFAKVIGDINTLQKDIMTYEVTYGTLPHTLTDVGRGDLRDPWGSLYEYTNYGDPGAKKRIRKDHNLHPLNSTYDVFSSGKDGQWKAPITAQVSQDDIIRANDGSYLGLASQF